MRGLGQREQTMVLLAVMLAAAPGVSSAAKWTLRRETPPLQEVTIDHASTLGKRDPEGTLRLEEGQRVRIRVINTRADCFEFGQREERATGTADRPPATEVSWTFDHDPNVTAYIVEAKARLPVSAECAALPLTPQTWRLPVKSLGWTLSFAGAFVGDTLTDPVFFLKPSKKPGDDTVTGFLAQRDRSAQDEYELGTSAMIHVYRTSALSSPSRGPRWVPVSFGLGISQQSETRYFLGTTVRFGELMFLTAGRVYGTRKRLPSALRADGFTTDSNALATLPNQNADAWFGAISFSFLGSSVRDAFGKAFATTPPGTPTTSGGGSGGGGTGGTGPVVHQLKWEPQPTPGNPPSLAVIEGVPLNLKLTRATATPGEAKVNVKVANGSASSPGDYEAGNLGDLTIKDNNSVTIAITPKDSKQGTRDFKITATPLPGSGVALSPLEFNVVIHDKPVVAWVAPQTAGTLPSLSVTEGTPLMIKVQRGGSDAPSLALKLTVTDGTAKQGTHFALVPPGPSTDFMLTPAAPSKDVTITPLDGTGERSFKLKVEAVPPEAATIAQPEITVSIKDPS